MNPIVELARKIQKEYGSNIETKVVSKTGPDHCPVIKVLITLPYGAAYYGEGSNQKIAKQNAAKKALEELEDE